MGNKKDVKVDPLDIDDHLFENLSQKMDMDEDMIHKDLMDKSCLLFDQTNLDLEDNAIITAWRQFIEFEEFTYRDVLVKPTKTLAEDDSESNNYSEMFVSEFERRANAVKSAGCRLSDSVLAFKLLKKCQMRDKADIEQFLAMIPPKMMEEDAQPQKDALPGGLDENKDLFGEGKEEQGNRETVLTLAKAYVRTLVIDEDQVRIRELRKQVKEESEDQTGLVFLPIKDDLIGTKDLEDDFVFDTKHDLEDIPFDDDYEEEVSQQPKLDILDLVTSVFDEEKKKKSWTELDYFTDDLKSLHSTSSYVDNYAIIVDKNRVDVSWRPTLHCADCLFLTSYKEEMAQHSDIRHRRLRCPDCTHTSKGVEKLKLHMRNFHGAFLIRCEKCGPCGEVFPTWPSYLVHLQQEHEMGPENNKFECEECEQIYTSFQYFNEHLNLAHRKTRYVCPKCNKIFGTQNQFLCHNRLHKVMRHCKECNKGFMFGKNLRIHRKKAHGISVRKHVSVKAKYPCDLCKTVCASRKYLLYHKKRSHEFDREGNQVVDLKCDKCDKSFLSRSKLKWHLKHRHSDVKYTCEECGKTFSSMGNLTVHKRAVHLNIRYLCKECPRQFRNETQLVRHENNAHGDNPVDESELCDKCGFRGKTKGALLQHKRKVHDFRIHYSCTQCDYAGRDTVELRAHITVKHEGKKIKCNACDFETTSLPSLYRHRSLSHVRKEGADDLEPNGKRIFSCDQCDFKCSSTNYLWVHKKSKHEGVTFKCKLCPKMYSTKVLLNNHIESAHENKRYECDQCDFVTKTALLLRNHRVKIHEQRYRTPCTQCTYVAPNPTSLKRHVRVKHEGIKYNCDQCDFGAPNPNSLRRHISVTHNLKRFYCDQCDYLTKDKYTLKIHKETKHQGIQYPCDECGMKFTLLPTLKKHKQTKHPPNQMMPEVKYVIPNHAL